MAKQNKQSINKKIICKCSNINIIILICLYLLPTISSTKINTNKLNEVLLAQHNNYRKMHGAEN